MNQETIAKILTYCEFNAVPDKRGIESGIATIKGVPFFGFELNENLSKDGFGEIVEICCSEQGILGILQFLGEWGEDTQGNDMDAFLQRIKKREKLKGLISAATI